jgi:hypothetical protein
MAVVHEANRISAELVLMVTRRQVDSISERSAVVGFEFLKRRYRAVLRIVKMRVYQTLLGHRRQIVAAARPEERVVFG